MSIEVQKIEECQFKAPAPSLVRESEGWSWIVCSEVSGRAKHSARRGEDVWC